VWAGRAWNWKVEPGAHIVVKTNAMHKIVDGAAQAFAEHTGIWASRLIEGDFVARKGSFAVIKDA
jgi:hypothetical protein